MSVDQEPRAGEAVTPGWVGRAVPRREDPSLVTGSARYIDDLELPGALHLRLVRSFAAHALLKGVRAAATGPGTVVVTAADLGTTPPALSARYRPREWPVPARPLLAHERVRFIGEPCAAVLAPDPYQAEDVAELVELQLEELPAVTDARAAAGGPPLHEECPGNLLFAQERAVGDLGRARRQADHSVRRLLRTDRHTGMPLETRGCAAAVEGGVLKLWTSTQLPHLVRSVVAETLGWGEERVEVITPHVGGGFGVKGHVYPEEPLVALLAVRLGAPVKWIEDRAEHLLASIHARDHQYDAELYLRADGTILGLRGDLVVDAGAYPVWPQTAALEVQMAGRILPGPYVVPSYRFSGQAMATNKSPLGTYRGVARPSCAFALERLLDEAARELAIDPLELRLRNVVEDFPYDTGTELEYDSASFRQTLELTRELLRREPPPAPRATTRTGVGVACFAEQTAHVPPWAEHHAGVVARPDQVRVRLDDRGRVTVLTGLNSHGQSQNTTLAQIVADQLGVDLDQVEVVGGDTAATPYSMGTLASRSAVVGGMAALQAATRLRERLLDLAASDWSVDAGRLTLRGGKVEDTASGRSLPLGELAGQHADADGPHGRPEIAAEGSWQGSPHGTFSNACHAAVVEVDLDTGQVHVLRYLVVEDCGQMINPLVVDGQIHGGVAQGLGSALLERLVYDEQGQLVTGTLMDYPLPSSAEVPDIEVHHLRTPGRGPLGAKGVGESGAIGVMAAVANAVADAVGPERARLVTQVPLTPPRVWAILYSGEG